MECEPPSHPPRHPLQCRPSIDGREPDVNQTNGRKAVLFDMDGVLVDSYEPHWVSWVESCAARGIAITPRQYDGLFGQSFRSFADALSTRPLSEAELGAWCHEKETRYRQAIEADFPAMAGASKLIRDLHAAGYAMGIASSGPRENVDCVLRLLPAAELFTATVSADDVRHAKPHPDVFLACATRLGVAPAACVVIEDSLHGLHAARAAGMQSVALVGTSQAEELADHADLVVDALRELTPAVMDALLANRQPRARQRCRVSRSRAAG